MKRLGFYNHFGNGDIFFSREFVKELIRLFPADEYVYYNGKSPRLLLDIPEIKVDNDVPSWLDPMQPTVKKDGNLYFNTWIGRDGKYVLPGSGCTISKFYEMYNDMLGLIGDKKLAGLPLDYLTTICYNDFEIDGITQAMDTSAIKRKKVFIANGNVQSNQAVNFDMTNVINKLAQAYPEVMFFTTELIVSDKENVYDANALTPKELSSNLNELSYLSTFCDVIIGRNSGPHVFTWTKENCYSDKINITFTKSINCSHFVYPLDIPMKTYWSNFTDETKVFEAINTVLQKEL